MNNNVDQHHEPTLHSNKQRLWQHPAYLTAWEYLPYGLQIRLLEFEARLDRIFPRRLHVKRRGNVAGLKRAVFTVLIAAVMHAIIISMQHSQ
ncbi:hypothetical protein GXB81_05610 [Paraburkholderia sp. Ac-20336]|uniref:hypothetical protein n=1 Tax=Burkholderiaceae TaxID=119060 RepID=UPI001423D53B|nr:MULTISPECIES: hypothetical protein [Burkholderiaceae]MBN3802530.1 hypothetical protein [Paraburkholderia sp. Ac-20336]NIF53052.1 hypothetical protein [Burkholderia sp. Ax-1724]NIF81522.1 hypothetical protein [Paraburkholderia sp. Cy-641]